MSGFFLIHRGWQDQPLFGNEPFDKRSAFIWLIENANFADKDIDINGKTVTVKRGQICASLRFMAKAWKWDEARVRRFLKRAQSEKIIDAATDAGQTVITLCNYEKYQAPKKQTDAANDAEAPQQRRGDDAKYKEGKEGKENIHSDDPDWLPARAWNDFQDFRRKARKPLTGRAKELAIQKLDDLRAQGNDPAQVINQSILNGWQGLFPVKVETSNQEVVVGI